MFIDVHCHLEMSENQDSIIKKCREKDVKIILTQGVNPETNRKSLELKEKYDIVKACLGLYPIDALKMKDSEIDGELEFIKKNRGKIEAIGEIGIDFKESLEKNERERQIKAFEKLVNLSLEMNKPVIIHSRKAEKECIEILERLKAKKVLMHCFSGNMGFVKRIADNGWYLSIPGNVTFSEHFQTVVKNVDLKRLLCETDAPYLHPIKGERDNDSSNVIESYKKIAEIKGISLKECEDTIYKNFKNLFGLL